MKKYRWLLCLLCAVMVIQCFLPIPCLAFDKKEHDKKMNYVFFRNFKDIENDASVADDIEALECASYLSIDQFNGNGQDDLDKLIKYGVKGIPASIGEIDIKASGTTHRSYTHRGWDFNYYDSPTWPTRKQLLINTVGKIFDFKGNTKQQESFSAIVYYIHILGDHLADSSYKVQNGLKIDVGGRTDENDVIHELKKHIAVVFKDQVHTHKYQSLMSSLDRYNSKLAKLVKSDGGINNDEKFKEKIGYANDLIELLSLYLPEMLRDEPFFNKTFY